MLLSALGFALMGAMVKICGSAGIPLLEIIAVRAGISVLLSLADIRRARVNPLGQQRLLLFARGLVGFVSLCCVFYAVLNLPYAEATILQYLHPVFTAGLAFLFLKEVPAKTTVACVALSLLGLIAMLLPSLGATQTKVWLPVLAGLGGAFGSGLAYTLVRKLAPTEHPAVIVLYFPMVCLPCALLLGGDQFVWPDLATGFALLGVGCFTQVGQICLTRAMQTDSASRATSLSYLQIIFAAILGLLLFGEYPDSYALTGAALILTGALINTRSPRPLPTASKSTVGTTGRD